MAITEQERRKRNLRDVIIIMLIMYIVGAFYMMHWGAVTTDPDYRIENVITDPNGLTSDINSHIRGQPFFIPEKSQLKPLYFFSFGYAILAAYLISLRRKFMFGKEHGTARWSDKKAVEKLVDKNFEKNILFTQTERLSLDTRKTRKNLNTLVIGGSGSGKTRFFAKPNIMQCNTSFVITDPKGEILRDTGKLLEENGYVLKVMNLIDMLHSDNYNPFHYVNKETDIIKLINCLVRNTTPANAQSNDPFWEKAETAFLQAIFFLLWLEYPEEQQNFNNVLRLMRMACAKDDEDFESDLDIIFAGVEKENPDHIAVKQYAIFKQAPGKTAQSILVSAGVRLSVFNVKTLADLTCIDTLELEDMGNQKTALFILVPDSDKTFNFIAAMLYTQLFDILYYAADFKNGGRLPYHVALILDEFANIGEIPSFDEYISTMRSREISVKIILQNIAQLKARYKDTWETIVGNCDSKLYLGGDEQSTTEYISKNLGKETIDTRNNNWTKGRNGSSSLNFGIHGRELMTPDELGHMPDSDCILMIRGEHPFYSNKFDLLKHPKYKGIADFSADNRFDVKKMATNTMREIMKSFDQNDDEDDSLWIGGIKTSMDSLNQFRYAHEYEIF